MMDGWKNCTLQALISNVLFSGNEKTLYWQLEREFNQRVSDGIFWTGLDVLLLLLVTILFSVWWTGKHFLDGWEGLHIYHIQDSTRDRRRAEIKANIYHALIHLLIIATRPHELDGTTVETRRLQVGIPDRNCRFDFLPDPGVSGVIKMVVEWTQYPGTVSILMFRTKRLLICGTVGHSGITEEVRISCCVKGSWFECLFISKIGLLVFRLFTF